MVVDIGLGFAPRRAGPVGHRVVHGADNVLKRIDIARGDVEAGLASAELVIDGDCYLPHQEQAYIENQGMTALFEDDGTLRISFASDAAVTS